MADRSVSTFAPLLHLLLLLWTLATIASSSSIAEDRDSSSQPNHATSKPSGIPTPSPSSSPSPVPSPAPSPAKGWSYKIDPLTKRRDKLTTRFHDGQQGLVLVMSDEFETQGRDFYSGRDDLFEAVEKPDDTNQAIQFCK